MGPSAGRDVQGLGRARTSLVRGFTVLLQGVPRHPVHAPISSWRRWNPPARCDASLFRRVVRAGGKAERGLSRSPAFVDEGRRQMLLGDVRKVPPSIDEGISRKSFADGPGFQSTAAVDWRVFTFADRNKARSFTFDDQRMAIGVDSDCPQVKTQTPLNSSLSGK